MNVLVTGGTGYLGREIVPRLVAAGDDVRIFSRRSNPGRPEGVAAVQGDLVTGDGVAEAVDGVDVIVHCASGTGGGRSLTYANGRKTDVRATANMLDLAKRTGSPHVVYISIVGVDRVPLGYYRAKLETEGVIEASGLPFSILRTTQWHTFVPGFLGALPKLPVTFVPKGVRAQFLDTGEVADRMVELVRLGPSGRVDDMGGPQTLSLAGAVRDYFRATGRRSAVIEMPVPGKAARGFREGGNLTPNTVGRRTFAEWLERLNP